MAIRKLKVATIVGTRPEIIRLSSVIKRFDEVFDHHLIHTGQNYDFELNEIFFQELGLRKPDFFLNAAGATPSETIGQIIAKADEVLATLKPDALLVLGDTNSCLAVIPAKRRKIPIFHMEAGNRCFDQRVPEEINRRIVDHVADINLTYSSIAREYLLREGLPPDQVIKTGSPMFEVLNTHRAAIEKTDVLKRLSLTADQYFLVSAHREENIDLDENFSRLSTSLNMVAETYGLPIIVSTHPRTRKRIEASAGEYHPLIQFLKPLGFLDYVHLQMHARTVLSDSGTISEESSILNFRALNIREAHERPEAMEEASVMMVGLSPERIRQGLELVRMQPVLANRAFREVEDYSAPNVSDKVARIVLSYVDYVRRNVWGERPSQ